MQSISAGGATFAGAGGAERAAVDTSSLPTSNSEIPMMEQISLPQRLFRGQMIAAGQVIFSGVPAAPPSPQQNMDRVDPGGQLVWAKVGDCPWWPAKVLSPHHDLSYPVDADPPRPTSIPVRFFGTHEFGWIGSKRALADWDDCFEKHAKECQRDIFHIAIQEVQSYKTFKVLPDVFYVRPEPQWKGRASKRSPAFVKGGSKKVSPNRAERSAMATHKRQQRLKFLGLKPPDHSPFVKGRLAYNPNLARLAISKWKK